MPPLRDRLCAVGMENYYIPTAFLCANALSFECGVTAHRREQADWVGALAHSATQAIMLLDSSKIGKNALARVTGIDALDTLVTDSEVDAETRARFRRDYPELEVIYA